MNELALGVEIIKCKEYLHKAGLEKTFRKSMCRVSVQNIPETLPHRLLDETEMVVAETRNAKSIQCGPHMRKAWV